MHKILSLSLLAFLAASPLFAMDKAPKPDADQNKFLASPLIKDAPVKGDFVQGDAKAKVKVVEYASLTCPHCAAFHETVVKPLTESHIKPGKIAYILRPFPLNEPALMGATLLDCVGEKKGADQYYNFARVLFEKQKEWGFDDDFKNKLANLVAMGGIDKKMFDACTTDKAREEKVVAIRKAGGELGVSHTPFILINGVPYTGKHEAAEFVKALDAAGK